MPRRARRNGGGTATQRGQQRVESAGGQLRTDGSSRGLGLTKAPDQKRKREEAGATKPGGKPLTQAEKDAQARRDAARARVEARTLKSLGL